MTGQLGGWALGWMWLYSVKPARRRRWTVTAAEVAFREGDEVERIADWQLSSITGPASQMQVDRKGQVGWNGDSYTVYQRCLFPGQSLVECCPSLIHPTIYQSITFPGSKPVCDMPHFTVMLRSCATASLIFSEPTGCICLRKKNGTSNQHHFTVYHHIQAESGLTRQRDSPLYLLTWRKTLREVSEVSHTILKPLPQNLQTRQQQCESMDSKRQVKRMDWDNQKLNNASRGQLDRQEEMLLCLWGVSIGWSSLMLNTLDSLS